MKNLIEGLIWAVREKKNQQSLNLVNWDYPIWGTKGTENEGNEQSPVGHHLTYQHTHNRKYMYEKKKKKNRKNISRNNACKL